ncbi:MAG: LptE family protein [Bacteroidales bacterium]
MELKCKAGRTHPGLIISGAILIAAAIVTSCSIKYSFSGVSISPNVKTISIQYFQNRASLVQPGLSQYITDALMDKCKAQTKLKFINGMGDVNFEGEITDYSTKPMTVAADSRAATNRFTISVKVKFTNAVQPEYNFENTFSRYQDYDSNNEFNNVEKELSDKIVEQLIEDIFNQAFVNW